MDYIEFKFVNGNILCRYVYNKKEIKLDESKAAKLYRNLTKSNYSYKKGFIKGEEAIRYYGVKLNALKAILNNRKNTKNKVSRINKYAKGMETGVSIGSGTLAILLLLNSYGALDIKGVKNENISEISVSITDTVFQGNYDNEEDIFVSVDENGIIESKDEIAIVDYVFNVDYEDRSDSDKANFAREMYTSVIDKYSKMFGLPTNLMVAVGTQENGVHEKEVSKGGGLGLFQIQVENGWNWVGKELTAYNYELGKYETVIVCQRQDGKIDVNMLSDLEYNTKIACMIMGSNVKMCNNDMIAALQCNNSGTKVLSLKKQYGDEWIEHRESLPGDPMYLEHVLSYIKEDDGLLEYKTIDGDIYVLGINNVYQGEVHKTK